MTIIIEHYPRRQPAVTALIRGALETDPSKAQRRSDAAVNTPLGWRGSPGPLQATSHSPSGQSTNNSVSHKDPPSLLPSLPVFTHVFLDGGAPARPPEGHPHESNQSERRSVNHRRPLPPPGTGQMARDETLDGFWTFQTGFDERALIRKVARRCDLRRPAAKPSLSASGQNKAFDV